MRSFDDVDYGRVEPFRVRPVLLDTARAQDVPLELDLAGTFLYLDDDTTGQVYVRFNSEDAARIPVKAGFSVSGIQYRRIYLDWTAQAGKRVNLVYGAEAQFTPTNDIANLGRVDALGEIDPVNYAGVSDWTIYQATAALQTIVTPAANVNGIRLYRGGVVYQNSRMMVKTSAPTDYMDLAADTLAMGFVTGSDYTSSGMAENILIPAGYGLYCQAVNAVSALAAFARYKVL